MDKTKKTENINEYMKNYMREYNKKINPNTGKSMLEKSYEYLTCEICEQKYMRSKKAVHCKTNKHKLADLTKKLQQVDEIK